MTENEILAEVKKAVDFFLDHTYEVKDLYSHLIQIINTNSDTGKLHKHQMERLIFKVEEMRERQRLFWGGNKTIVGECKQLEMDLDKKIMYLQTHGGYSIQRFKEEKAKQKGLFD